MKQIKPYKIDSQMAHTAYGWMIYPSADMYVSGSLRRWGVYSPSELAVYYHTIQPGWTCLDGGANIGVMSLAMASGGARVVAFEPQPMVFKFLQANVALNNLGNQVQCIQAALADAQGEIKTGFFQSNVGESNFGQLNLQDLQRIAGPNASVTVPVVTIDDLWEPEGMDLNFIKLDIEGMEPMALRGGARTIARCHPVMMIECDKPASSQDTIETILSMGYTPHWIVTHMMDPGAAFWDQDPQPPDPWPNQASFNLLCTRPEHAFINPGFRIATTADPIASIDRSLINIIR